MCMHNTVHTVVRQQGSMEPEDGSKHGEGTLVKHPLNGKLLGLLPLACLSIRPAVA